MMLELVEPKTHAVLKVIGVGGAGGNAVNGMVEGGLNGVEFVVMNSDAQVLEQSLAPLKVQLGATTTQGLGCGGKPEIGRQSAEESVDEIRDAVRGADMVFMRVKDESLIGALLASWRSPTLALNDLGYVDRQDLFFSVLWLQYRRLEPIGPIASFQVNFNGWLYRNTSFLNIGDGGNVNFDMLFKNDWNVGADVGYHPGRCNDRETRSEGRVAFCTREDLVDTGVWFGTDSRKVFSASFGLGLDETEDGYDIHTRLNLSLKPVSRLQLELVPRYHRVTGDIRWIDTQETGSGERFLFAWRHSDVWDVTLRGTFTFTTDLTLQAYAQAFAAIVDYGKKLAGPVPAGSRIYVSELAEAGDVDDSYDFTDTSLNVSVVLRWEYLPGSVGYLVYTGAFGRSRDQAVFASESIMSDMFGSDARHVLMLKASYLFN